jgi:chemotaxis family two-component system response regulator Rcp1
VAEDNLPDALIVREAIKREKLPVEVFIAPDGEKALEFFRRAGSDEASPTPQALLLDLNLPKVDGLEVLRALRAIPRFKDIPVLVVTSSDSPEDREDAARLGARYFRKPVTYGEFLRIGGVIRQLLNENNLL